MFFLLNPYHIFSRKFIRICKTDWRKNDKTIALFKMRSYIKFDSHKQAMQCWIRTLADTKPQNKKPPLFVSRSKEKNCDDRLFIEEFWEVWGEFNCRAMSGFLIFETTFKLLKIIISNGALILICGLNLNLLKMIGSRTYGNLSKLMKKSAMSNKDCDCKLRIQLCSKSIKFFSFWDCSNSFCMIVLSLICLVNSWKVYDWRM